MRVCSLIPTLNFITIHIHVRFRQQRRHVGDAVMARDVATGAGAVTPVLVLTPAGQILLTRWCGTQATVLANHAVPSAR